MVYKLYALKIHDKEYCQQAHQKADGVTQRTIDECTREVAKKQVVPECFDDNDKQFAQSNHRDTIVDIKDEKVQGYICEDIDDDRRAKHQPASFPQQKQDDEFYQNRWDKGHQQRRKYRHRLKGCQ